MEENNTVNEILKIKHHIEDFGISVISPHKLAEINVKLAILLVNLGQEISESTRDYNIIYSYKKFKKVKDFKVFRKRVPTVTEATNEATLLSEETVEKEIQKQYEVDSLKVLYESISRLIICIQSYLKILSQESKNQI